MASFGYEGESQDRGLGMWVVKFLARLLLLIARVTRATLP
jgi:hypothetical protein